MALLVKCNNPQSVLDNFRKKIEGGEIITWVIDEEGDLSISNVRWIYKAWMRPKIEGGNLIFGYIASSKFGVTKGLYGIFHGRLATTLLANFDELISSIELEAQLNPKYDRF